MPKEIDQSWMTRLISGTPKIKDRAVPHIRYYEQPLKDGIKMNTPNTSNQEVIVEPQVKMEVAGQADAPKDEPQAKPIDINGAYQILRSDLTHSSRSAKFNGKMTPGKWVKELARYARDKGTKDFLEAANEYAKEHLDRQIIEVTKLGVEDYGKRRDTMIGAFSQVFGSAHSVSTFKRQFVIIPSTFDVSTAMREVMALAEEAAKPKNEDTELSSLRRMLYETTVDLESTRVDRGLAEASYQDLVNDFDLLLEEKEYLEDRIATYKKVKAKDISHLTDKDSKWAQARLEKARTDHRRVFVHPEPLPEKYPLPVKEFFDEEGKLIATTQTFGHRLTKQEKDRLVAWRMAFVDEHGLNPYELEAARYGEWRIVGNLKPGRIPGQHIAQGYRLFTNRVVYRAKNLLNAVVAPLTNGFDKVIGWVVPINVAFGTLDAVPAGMPVDQVQPGAQERFANAEEIVDLHLEVQVDGVSDEELDEGMPELTDAEREQFLTYAKESREVEAEIDAIAAASESQMLYERIGVDAAYPVESSAPEDAEKLSVPEVMVVKPRRVLDRDEMRRVRFEQITDDLIKSNSNLWSIFLADNENMRGSDFGAIVAPYVEKMGYHVPTFVSAVNGLTRQLSVNRFDLVNLFPHASLTPESARKLWLEMIGAGLGAVLWQRSDGITPVVEFTVYEGRNEVGLPKGADEIKPHALDMASEFLNTRWYIGTRVLTVKAKGDESKSAVVGYTRIYNEYELGIIIPNESSPLKSSGLQIARSVDEAVAQAKALMGVSVDVEYNLPAS
jgi:hypothetical protein